MTRLHQHAARAEKAGPGPGSKALQWDTLLLPRFALVGEQREAVSLYYGLCLVLLGLYLFTFLTLQPHLAYSRPYGGHVQTQVDLAQSLRDLASNKPAYCSGGSTPTAGNATLPCLFWSPTQILSGGRGDLASAGLGAPTLFLTTRLDLLPVAEPPPGCGVRFPLTAVCREMEDLSPGRVVSSYHIADVERVVVRIGHVLVLEGSALPIPSAAMAEGQLVFGNGTTVPGDAFSVAQLLGAADVGSLDALVGGGTSDTYRGLGLALTITIDYRGRSGSTSPAGLSYTYRVAAVGVPSGGSASAPPPFPVRTRELVPNDPAATIPARNGSTATTSSSSWIAYQRTGLHLTFVQVGRLVAPAPLGALMHLAVFVLLHQGVRWLVLLLCLLALPGRQQLRARLFAEEGEEEALPPVDQGDARRRSKHASPGPRHRHPPEHALPSSGQVTRSAAAPRTDGTLYREQEEEEGAEVARPTTTGRPVGGDWGEGEDLPPLYPAPVPCPGDGAPSARPSMAYVLDRLDWARSHGLPASLPRDTATTTSRTTTIPPGGGPPVLSLFPPPSSPSSPPLPPAPAPPHDAPPGPAGLGLLEEGGLAVHLPRQQQQQCDAAHDKRRGGVLLPTRPVPSPTAPAGRRPPLPMPIGFG